MTLSRAALAGLLLLPLLALGCSSGNTLAPAKISGSVSYKGKPVTGGTVQFVDATGVAYPAVIADDGTYAVNDVPEGELIVTVETESVNPERKEAAQGKDYNRRMNIAQQPPPSGSRVPNAQEQKAKYVKIPGSYANPKTTPLTYTANRGRQVYNIELD